MSPRALLFFLLVGAVAIIAVKANYGCPPPPPPPTPKPHKCGPNEVWTDCGTACPLSCKNPKPTICTKQCVIGCQCKQGYLRNHKGHCVLPCDC